MLLGNSGGNAMLPNEFRRSCGLTSLLQRSVQFLSGLRRGVISPTLSSLSLSSLNLTFPSLRGQCLHIHEEKQEQQELENLLNRADIAGCLLNTKTHMAEVQTSLLTSLFAKPHWNNTITHSMTGQAVAKLEKEITDNVAILLHLPSRFFWLPLTSEEERLQRLNYLSLQQQQHQQQLLYHTSSDVSVLKSQSPILHSSNTSTSINNAINNNNNLSGGGGILHETSLESLIVLLTTARAQAHARYLSAHFTSPEDESRLTQRLVLYCSDQCHPLLKKAARCMGIQHIRVLQTVYSPYTHNYPMQVDRLKEALAEDVAKGLYPLMVCGVFGAHATGAVDPLEELADLCRRVKLWFHIDASHSGMALAADYSSTIPLEHYGYYSNNNSDNNNNNNNNNNQQHQEVKQEDNNLSRIPVLNEMWNSAAAAETSWEQNVMTFRNASSFADSIHFTISNSFLPTLSSVSSASLLYVDNISKVATALQRMNAEDEASANMWCTPMITDMSRLRLHYPEMRSNEIIRLALTFFQQKNVFSISYKVRSHQVAMSYLEQRLRADGRFDCSVHASYFGMVLFRWLTLADEETEALMWRWSSILTSLNNEKDSKKDTPCSSSLPRVFLGLARVQRRLHICVGISSGSKKNISENENEYVSKGDVDALMDTLKLAADSSFTTERNDDSPTDISRGVERKKKE
ncbi:tyrosine decarboxylase [Trypanosoma theileri]|uniref:Tyrosine decarboxylase n=1 Tax=Trypanosoma theileri TaxID=67003 RepID=A0A1X0P0L1_9TRYP|nr:tyrosine decarboxylase [Trypanosoma theileri]ORC89950.1 tyrosine decarboxylase [Trypanosoma theileri]